MRNGLQAAIQARYTDIHIEGDNQILILAVQGRIQPSWEIHTLVQDILAYVKKCNKILISHIFQENNCTTDWVVKSGHAIQFKIVCFGVLHQDLFSILREDNLGRTELPRNSLTFLKKNN